MTELSGKVYFAARDSVNDIGQDQYGLWRSDGTSNGTVRLKTGLRPQLITKAGNEIFFAIGNELWGSDGTAVGTRMIYSFMRGDIRGLRASPLGKLYVSILGSGRYNDEIWLYDPSDRSTTILTALAHQSQVAIPFFEAVVNNLFMTVLNRETSGLSLQRIQLR